MDSIGGDSGASFGPAELLAAWAAATSRRFQYYLDKANPHVGRRWAALGLLALAYVLRVAFVHGFYVVSYGLAIWILNLLIAFLSPQVDPEIEELLGNGGDAVGPTLPTKSSDEFRPFVRRLPEFKFWYSITKAFCIAFVMTFFGVFDVPVFWPVLVFYWLVLFMLTMKRQILHMLKYKYVPFSFGKRRYAGKKGASTDDAKVSVG